MPSFQASMHWSEQGRAMMGEPITILIVDDHAVVRHGARAFFEMEEDFLVVGAVSSGGEAVLLAADLAPDVVLMDLAMPGTHALEATPRIQQKNPPPQIVILTS